MPAEKYWRSPMSYNAIDGTFWVLSGSDGQGLEKLPWMKDTRSGTAEKTQNTSMVWHLLYGKKL